MTLIEAAKTMLADSLLPVTFWAEAVNTACYVLNRALVTKTHNKTLYELLNGRSPRLDFMRPFGCHVTILNTLDYLGKFKGKADVGFLVGYSVTSKAFREVFDQHYIVFPLYSSISSTYKSSNYKPADDKPKDDIGSKTVKEPVNKEDQAYRDELDRLMSQEKEAINAASTSGTFSAGGPSSPHPDAFIPDNTLLHVDQDDSQIPDLEETTKLQKADFNNMESSTIVSLIPIHKMEPKKVSQALDDESWVEAIQEELLNKKDERGIVVRNKARQVAQGHRQEEGIDYDEVFAPVARIKAIKIFLAFASFMRFIVYQMDIKSAFLYGTIEEEVYVSQPPGFIDPRFPNKVYKVEKALYGLHQAPRAWYLKGQPKLGLWYPRDSPFNLDAYSDSDYAGVNLDMKSTTRGCQFLGRRLTSRQCKKQTIVATSTTKIEYVAVAHCCGQAQRNHIGGADAQTRFETASKRSSDPPLSTGHIVRSEEDRMEQETDLTDFVLPTPHDLPLLGGSKDYTRQGDYTLKLRIMRLEKKRKARTSQPIKRRLFKGRVETSTNKNLGNDASKKGRNDDQTEDLNLTNGVDIKVIVEEKGSGEKGGSTADQVSTARPEVSVATSFTPPTTTTIFGDEDLSIAQTLIKIKNLAQRIYEGELAELDRAQKRQKQEEATIAALTEEFDEIQARMDVDHKLVVRMTHEEQEMYKIKERTRLLAEYFEKRKKQLAAERAEAIRNKPPIRTQVRNRMITYLKHMEKRYPLIKEMLEKMLNWKLEAKAKNTMEIKLLNFIKLQIEE
nr:retrovirus-related Pol polyprotein from transposon TNT 1-94 [Tanacetum cinerariifolium]